MGKRLVFVATAAACAALASGCGSTSSTSSSTGTDAAAVSRRRTNLDTAHVARAIERSILAQRHLRAKVACPAVVSQRQGVVFTCIANNRSVRKPSKLIRTPFKVIVQNDRGYVTYRGE